MIKRQYLITAALLCMVLIAAIVVTVSVLRQNAETFKNEAKSDLLGDDEMAAPYTDILGNEVSLDQYAGNVLVINSWASWSPQSREELLVLDRIAQDYSGRGVVVLAINRKEPKNQAQRFLETLTDVARVTVLIDLTDHFYGAVDGYAMPQTVVYKSDGTIASHIHGAFNEQELRELLEEISAQN